MPSAEAKTAISSHSISSKPQLPSALRLFHRLQVFSQAAPFFSIRCEITRGAIDPACCKSGKDPASYRGTPQLGTSTRSVCSGCRISSLLLRSDGCRRWAAEARQFAQARSQASRVSRITTGESSSFLIAAHGCNPSAIAGALISNQLLRLFTPRFRLVWVI